MKRLIIKRRKEQKGRLKEEDLKQKGAKTGVELVQSRLGMVGRQRLDAEEALASFGDKSRNGLNWSLK